MKVQWSEVTAIFGGAFDPPHLGHREAVRGLFRYPGVKRVLILPTAVPPHKLTHTEIEHRVAMVRLNFYSTAVDFYPEGVEVGLLEIHRFQSDRKPSYTFDSLLELRHQISSLAWVIGADQLKDLSSWYRFPEILGLCHWIVLARKPAGENLANTILSQWQGSGLVRMAQEGELSGQWFIEKFKTYLKIVPTGAPALSSSEIRRTLEQTGEAPTGALLPEVLAYLSAKQLYGIHKT